MGKNQKQEILGLDILAKTGIFASFLLVSLISTFIYSPVIKTHASEGKGTVSSSLQVSASINPIIAMTTSADEVNMEEGDTSLGHTFPTANVSIDVSTNSLYGYTLTMEDSDDDTNLEPTTENVTAAFSSSFDGAVLKDEMADNTWGFSLDGDAFSAIPALGSPVTLKNTTSLMTTPKDTTDVVFGAKIGMIPAGAYKDVVQFTAIVNGLADST
jgi:hypothetical protein